MNRFKLIIFSILIVVVVFSLLFPTLRSNNMTIKDSEVLTKGDYEIGKDLAPGAYDIEVLEGSVVFSGRELTQEDNLKGLNYTNQEHIIITGTGKVLLSKAKFASLTHNELGNYVIKHSGLYKIGEQIKSGEYIISYTVQNNQSIEEKPYIQILNESDHSAIESFEVIDQYKVNLNESDLLQVNKTLFEENDDIIVILSTTTAP